MKDLIGSAISFVLLCLLCSGCWNFLVDDSSYPPPESRPAPFKLYTPETEDADSLELPSSEIVQPEARRIFDADQQNSKEPSRGASTGENGWDADGYTQQELEAKLEALLTRKPARPQFLQRTWTSVDRGYSTDAKLVSTDGFAVTLRKADKSTIEILKEKLIADDRVYVHIAHEKITNFDKSMDEWNESVESLVGRSERRYAANGFDESFESTDTGSRKPKMAMPRGWRKDAWTALDAQLQAKAIEFRKKESRPVGTDTSDSKDRIAVEFVRTKYRDLLSRKDEASFKEWGFSVGGPHHQWLKEVEQFRKRPEYQRGGKASAALTGLVLMGMEYLTTYGNDNIHTRRWRSEIEEFIGSAHRLRESNAVMASPENLVPSGVKGEAELNALSEADSSKSQLQSSLRWYEGGTLVNKTGLDWRAASARNKLASSADIVAAMWNRKQLVPELQSKIRSMDDMKPLAQNLADNLDAAFKPLAAPAHDRMLVNQVVATFAAILLKTMRWIP